MTSFEKRFGLAGPLAVAPLGGGPTTPELVIATSNAGALGSLAAAYLSPAQIDEAVAKINAATRRPYAINLFAPMPKIEVGEARLKKAVEATSRHRAELGLPLPRLEPPFHPDFDQQFERVLRARPMAFSFVFGNLAKYHLRECSKLGIYTIGTATTLEEAEALVEHGIDAVTAQGTEAGGHRGIFMAESAEPGIGTLELTRQLSSKLKVPVIAAGGMMTGADIANALKAGAQAAMLGTAFLLTPEAGTSQPYRQALVARRETRLTRAFSGRLARGLVNRFMNEVDDDHVLPFPAQNAFTRDIRTRAAAENNPEFLSLWSGTGIAKIRQMPAADLVATLLRELRAD